MKEGVRGSGKESFNDPLEALAQVHQSELTGESEKPRTSSHCNGRMKKELVERSVESCWISVATSSVGPK